MILVTVGTDLPFNRLVETVDSWAQRNNRSDVFAQIGHTDWKPKHIAYTQFIEPVDFNKRFTEADVIIAHAGMGTILSALKWGKPLLVMPRRASLGEQRNEHQLATARHLQALGKITVAVDEAELLAWLDKLDQLDSKARVGPHASTGLIEALQGFIHGK
ncbi:glycosyltransferase [Nibricoccus sp. IMCC34717]|uniref:glycosyltransferase n=1 Tax=Nibricoccus sp. IMCC34717 TaxID=3034021 RepID=UPI00384DC506